LASAQTNADESIAWINLSQNDLLHFHSDVEDTHAFINHLLVLNNLKVACMFRDDGQSVKVSLRSTGDIDVGLMATKIGGGGHCHSAATIINKNGKSTAEITKEVISKVQEMIDQSA
jgi:phosphoesterase RecJ-like protein